MLYQQKRPTKVYPNRNANNGNVLSDDRERGPCCVVRVGHVFSVLRCVECDGENGGDGGIL
jgi:hypothetical protein